ncbi:MAG: hypothetical protein A2731_01020 [Candidatus Buchananbacteria bacterium RIFCSPHIGHO2_01_FULL_39_8]|uniref:UDP-N-acetylmuramoyl-tripeptide--D-alanyl-D-alanine ligase n=1 Tax=Candidatus Buchananbacteria bacterium RIFCSPHIGHO2_01_FULL_39_8 TaxID=1797533 RepID=A0A1G1XY44_9BACT|nr:MAG: hypothetical protein A2731_01020 [Candidatus Buchananbacteria bacterium RIFCSPHIGHO2_01_FULL_39_8]
MKNIFRKLLEKILRVLALVILNKYKPEVVAVTGSVGKTSTKAAIYSVLSSTYNVRQNQKNYNNEIGIPLTIIGAETGGKSIFKWLVVFLKAISLIIIKDKKYPQILVMEMGADHSGDIKYLTDFVLLKVGVVTAVAPVHLEFFETMERIAKEKAELIRSLPKDGYAILNHDDKLVYPMSEKTKAKVITFGLLEGSDVRGREIAISHDVNYKDISTIQGISFKLIYEGKTVPVLLPKILGEHLIYTALAAISVGLVFDLNLHTIINSLKNFEPPKGRMHIIKGIKNTLIIDDTYNSSPLAAKKALYQLGKINLGTGHKKFAVLGDMFELGSYTEQGHQEVGEAVVEYKIDYLITVGEMSRDIIRGAIERGMNKDNCFNFKDSVEAGRFLQQKISEGDLILIKGSQGVRTERAVKEIMAEPEKAKELLTRQYEPWV